MPACHAAGQTDGFEGQARLGKKVKPSRSTADGFYLLLDSLDRSDQEKRARGRGEIATSYIVDTPYRYPISYGKESFFTALQLMTPLQNIFSLPQSVLAAKKHLKTPNFGVDQLQKMDLIRYRKLSLLFLAAFS